MAETWRRCNACKNPIEVRSTYYVCNVSTCNRKRTGMTFCSVSCWEVHLPSANHREAWALERTAPATPEAPEAPTPAPVPRKPERPAPQPAARPAPAPRPSADVPREVLIVASRLKDYIRARSGMNTSDGVLGPLSDIVREVCDRAIESARRNERKTVLERDVPER